MKKDILNPKELGPAPRFYSHAVSVTTPGKLVYVSGQVSWGPDGHVIGKGDMRAQVAQIFQNLTNVLRAAGAGWNDVIKMNAYMVGLNAENIAAYREARAAYFTGVTPPASTLVGVTSLVDPDLLLEVEVVAALGGAARKALAKKPAAKKKRR